MANQYQITRYSSDWQKTMTCVLIHITSLVTNISKSRHAFIFTSSDQPSEKEQWTERTEKGIPSLSITHYITLHTTECSSTAGVTAENKFHSNYTEKGGGSRRRHSNYMISRRRTNLGHPEGRIPQATHSSCHHHGPLVALKELPELLVPMAVVIKREAQLPDRLPLPLCAIGYHKLLLLNLFLELAHPCSQV